MNTVYRRRHRPPDHASASHSEHSRTDMSQQADRRQLRKSEDRVSRDRERMQRTKPYRQNYSFHNRNWRPKYKRYVSKSHRGLDRDIIDYELEQHEIDIATSE